MNFLDCIQTAAASGKLSEKKATEIAEEFEAAKATAEAEGVTPDKLDTEAALKALEATTQLKASQRWAKINEMRKAHELYTRINESARPWEELDKIAETLQLDYVSASGDAMRGIGGIILKYMPQAGGLRTSIENMDNIIHALYNDTGRTINAEARAFAQAAGDAIEYLRKQLNLEGANLPDNPNFRFPQSHQRDLVDKIDHGIRDANGVYSGNEWINDQLEHLDWEMMRYNDKPIPVDQRVAVLSKTFDAIITDGDIRLRPAQANNQSLAGRLSESRFLHYKSGDSWIAMQNKYGSGNFYHQLIAQIDTMSRDLALLRTFGPNPASMKGFVERTVDKRASDLQLEKKTGARKVADLKTRAKNRFDSQYAIFTRAIDMGGDNFWASAANTFRSLSSSAVLGNVFVSALVGDVAAGAWTRKFYKMPTARLIPAYFQAMVNPKKMTRQMISDGILFESGITRAYESQRYIASMEGPHIARVISDLNYRISLAHLATSSGKGIAGGDFSRGLAAVRHMKFDDVPFSHVMQSFGITEKDWDIMRHAPLYEPEYYQFGKGEFLRPSDLLQNAGNEAERQAAIKFRRLQTQFVNDAVPSPLLRSRAYLGEHLPATSIAGQMIRATNQLMLFSATIHFNHWKKIWNAPTVKDKLVLGSRWFAYTTIAGAMITVLKDVISGKEPALERMVPGHQGSLDFWGRAMLNGGGGAIVGDLIYSQLSANPYTGEKPVQAQARRFFNALDETYNWATGEEDSKALAASGAFVDGLIPKPWMVKLIWEREVTDRLLEETDPAAYERKIRYQAKIAEENGQESFFGVGEHLFSD